MIVVGDNKGVVRVFQVTHDSALLLAAHELNKGIEVHSREDAINDIHITSDE